MRSFIIMFMFMLILSFSLIFDRRAEAIWLIDFVSHECRVETVEFDYNNDGIVDEAGEFTYSGNRLMEVRYEHSSGDIRVENFIYGNGVLERVEYDLDNDGNVNEIGYLEYGEDDRLQQVSYDLNNDGEINKLETIVYNNRGIVVRKEFRAISPAGTHEDESLNDPGDGTGDSPDESEIISVQYLDYEVVDGRSRLSEIEEWDNFREEGGEIMEIQSFVYFDDGTVERINHQDVGGEIFQTTALTWDCRNISDDGGSGGSSGSNTTCFIDGVVNYTKPMP